MPEGPSGVPRPLAEASLSVNLYYLGDQYNIEGGRVEQRLSQKLDNDPSGIITAFIVSSVEASTFDISNDTSLEDTVVSVELSNPQGTIQRLVTEGSLGPTMEIAQSTITTIKQVVNLQVDDGPEEVTVSIG